MKWILWLGIMPLIFGFRLLWRWIVVDKRQWAYLDSTYKRALPLRIFIALALIALGIYLFFFVGNYLANYLSD